MADRRSRLLILATTAALALAVAAGAVAQQQQRQPQRGRRYEPGQRQQQQQQRERVVPAQTRRAGDAEPKIDLPKYEGRYYVIHSDLDRDLVREADLRMSRMAETYHARTKDFAGQIRSKLPFYLFKDEADYRAFGGMKNTAGMFNGRALMAIAGGDEQTMLETWHTVQHEGFHQFAIAVIGGDLPIWVNEGLAEYFGEAVFTGDAYVPGVIPEWRRRRIVDTLEDKRNDGGAFMPVEAMLNLSHAEWNRGLSLTNYDQAWSMVHFLAHGEDGRYQKPFAAFMRAVGGGEPWRRAWQQTMGSADGFGQRWRAYWKGLDADPTDELYVQAAVRGMTNFLARAHVRQQRFGDFKAFFDAAANGGVTAAPDDRDWLPPSVLETSLSEAVRLAENGYTFALSSPAATTAPAAGAAAAAAKLPYFTVRSPGGTTTTGRFTLKGARVGEVVVESDAKSSFARPSQRR